MDSTFNRKYQKVLEILPDVAACAEGKLVLVGGTALALFYLKHRVSVDLDFVPVSGDDVRLKGELKGCLSKKGYRTTPGAYQNQFVVQFEDTGIKVEVFEPAHKIRRTTEHAVGISKILVASMDDIFDMKLLAYAERKEARDLFDIFCILKSKGLDFGPVRALISENGTPHNLEDVENMAMANADAAAFSKVVFDAAS